MGERAWMAGRRWSARHGLLVCAERLPAIYLVVAATGRGADAQDSQPHAAPRLKCGQRLTLQCKCHSFVLFRGHKPAGTPQIPMNKAEEQY